MRSETVAIVNTNPDVIETIQDLLESAGFLTCAVHLADLKAGRVELPDFLKEHDPGTVVVDIPPDYEENARWVDQVLRPQLRGRKLILTSTNAQRVSELLEDTVFPILEKPYGLDRLIDTVLDREHAAPSA
jgi:DNA-binding NtrC family response regulator